MRIQMSPLFQSRCATGHTSSQAQSRVFTDEPNAQALANQVTDASLLVVDRHEETQVEYPPLPFSTALLLEEATVVLGWTVARVTDTAQQLFEAGLITYPRTDSTHLAPEAMQLGQHIIVTLFGPEAVGNNLMGEARITPPNPAQTHWWQGFWQTPAPLVPAEEETPLEAHEAIRPTDPTHQPEALQDQLAPDLLALYTLIWTRFLASLMKPARYRVITLDLEPIP